MNKSEYPDQPWMWRDDWAKSSIRDSNRSKTIGLWIFAILWNAISFPMAWHMRTEISREDFTMVFLYLFPLIGIFIFIAAVVQTVRSLRFGTSVCHLERVPIVPGRAFRGDVEVKTDVVPADGYRLRIMLVRITTPRTGRKRSSTERLVWDSEIFVDSGTTLRSPMGTRIPFHFATPPDSHPTDETDLYDRHVWRMNVSADLPGVDYAAQFELPVFQTGERADGSEFAAFEERHRAQARRHRIAPNSGVEITPLPAGGEEFRIRAAKSTAAVIGNLTFLVALNAAVVASIRFHGPWLLSAVLVAIDVLFLLAAVNYFFGQSTVEVGRNGLRVRKSWLGYAPEPESYEEPAIDSVEGTTAGAEGKAFGVTLKLRDGNKKILATSLRDRESADAVAARMMTALGRAGRVDS